MIHINQNKQSIYYIAVYLCTIIFYPLSIVRQVMHQMTRHNIVYTLHSYAVFITLLLSINNQNTFHVWYVNANAAFKLILRTSTNMRLLESCLCNLLEIWHEIVPLTNLTHLNAPHLEMKLHHVKSYYSRKFHSLDAFKESWLILMQLSV